MTHVSGEWISQRQAADLVGVPEHVIEWNCRAGKFVKCGEAPSLSRESVLAWAAAREARRQRAAARRAHVPRSPRPPEPEGWLEVGEAAEVLGLGRESVLRLVQEGGWSSAAVGVGTTFLSISGAGPRGGAWRWVSAVEASREYGLAASTFLRAAADGRVEQRHVSRVQPSLCRESVEEFVVAWRADQERHARARREREAVRRPPEEGKWVTAAEAARALGVSAARMRQLVRADRLTAVKRGKRWWVRQDEVERRAAGR